MKKILLFSLFIFISFLGKGQSIKTTANKYESSLTQIVVTNHDKITYAVVDLHANTYVYKQKDGQIVEQRVFPKMVKEGKEKWDINYTFFSFNNELHFLKHAINKKTLANAVEIIQLASDDINKVENSAVRYEFISKNRWINSYIVTSGNGKHLILGGLEKYYYLFDAKLELVEERSSAPMKHVAENLFVTNNGDVIAIFYPVEWPMEFLGTNFLAKSVDINATATMYIFDKNDNEQHYSLQSNGLVNRWLIAQTDSGNIAVAGYAGEIVKAKGGIAIGYNTLASKAIAFKLFDKKGELISEKSVALNENWDLLRLKKLVYLADEKQFALVGEEMETSKVTSDDLTQTKNKYDYGSIAVNFFNEQGKPGYSHFIYRRNTYHPYDEKIKFHSEGLIVHNNENKVILAFNTCQEYIDIKDFDDKAPVLKRALQAGVYTVSPTEEITSYLIPSSKEYNDNYQTDAFTTSSTTSKIYCAGYGLGKIPIFEVAVD